jgi:IS4 transposase
MWSRGKTKQEDQDKATIKENLRWAEGYERVTEMAARCPATRLVYVADREGDILGLMKRSQALNYPADWLVRAKHNRKLTADEKPRQIKQEIKVLRCTLPLKEQNGLEVTLVQAKEIDPPKGKVALTWRLLTNRCIDTEEQALELIDWYRCRWEIEMFFDILKVGCHVEK